MCSSDLFNIDSAFMCNARLTHMTSSVTSRDNQSDTDLPVENSSSKPRDNQPDTDLPVENSSSKPRDNQSDTDLPVENSSSKPRDNQSDTDLAVENSSSKLVFTVSDSLSEFDSTLVADRQGITESSVTEIDTSSNVDVSVNSVDNECNTVSAVTTNDTVTLLMSAVAQDDSNPETDTSVALSANQIVARAGITAESHTVSPVDVLSCDTSAVSDRKLDSSLTSAEYQSLVTKESFVSLNDEETKVGSTGGQSEVEHTPVGLSNVKHVSTGDDGMDSSVQMDDGKSGPPTKSAVIYSDDVQSGMNSSVVHNNADSRRELSVTEDNSQLIAESQANTLRDTRAETDLSTVRDVSTDRDLSTKKDLSTQRDISVDRDLSTERDMSTEKDLSTDRDMSTEKDFSTQRDMPIEQHLSIDRDMSTERVMSMERDLSTIPNVDCTAAATDSQSKLESCVSTHSDSDTEVDSPLIPDDNTSQPVNSSVADNDSQLVTLPNTGCTNTMPLSTGSRDSQPKIHCYFRSVSNVKQSQTDSVATETDGCGNIVNADTSASFTADTNNQPQSDLSATRNHNPTKTDSSAVLLGSQSQTGLCSVPNDNRSKTESSASGNGSHSTVGVDKSMSCEQVGSEKVQVIWIEDSDEEDEDKDDDDDDDDDDDEGCGGGGTQAGAGSMRAGKRQCSRSVSYAELSVSEDSDEDRHQSRLRHNRHKIPRTRHVLLFAGLFLVLVVLVVVLVLVLVLLVRSKNCEIGRGMFRVNICRIRKYVDIAVAKPKLKLLAVD